MLKTRDIYLSQKLWKIKKNLKKEYPKYDKTKKLIDTCWLELITAEMFLFGIIPLWLVIPLFMAPISNYSMSFLYIVSLIGLFLNHMKMKSDWNTTYDMVIRAINRFKEDENIDILELISEI